MKRSLQEVAELVVFGLIALLVGTGLLWLVGWVLSLGGLLLKSLAGLLWLLLRYIVPIAIVAGLVYFLVKAAQGRQPQSAKGVGGTDAPPASPPASQTSVPTAQATVPAVAASAAPAVDAAQSQSPVQTAPNLSSNDPTTEAAAETPSAAGDDAGADTEAAGSDGSDSYGSHSYGSDSEGSDSDASADDTGSDSEHA